MYSIRVSNRRFYWSAWSLIVVTVLCSLQFTSQRRYAQQLKASFQCPNSIFNSTYDPFIPRFFNETDSKKPPGVPRQFPIEEEDFCAKRPELDYIVYVHTALKHVEARNDTRMTWANKVTAEKLGVKIAVVFIAGQPKNEEEEIILKSESETYHDMIQGDFADEYKLLTYKGMAGLYWLTCHCNNVPWTIHTDDDVLIDLVLLDKLLKERGVSANNEFLCYVLWAPPVMRDGKWQVDVEDFPDHNYPVYCNGPFWAIQTRNLLPLLNASQYVNFLWIDDAYLTGLLAKEVGGIGHILLPEGYKLIFDSFQESQIGNTAVWCNKRGARRENWRKVLEYYQEKLNIPTLAEY